MGTPGTVIDKLNYVEEHLNPGYPLIYGDKGPMPQKDYMRSIELLGNEMIPPLKEIKLRSYEVA